MKAAYEFLVGNSIVTPIGLALAVAAAYALLHARLGYAGVALVGILLATLALSVFERVN
ncbi:MAG: hypothetical protein JOZ97_08820 [Candidatus Eremiobacteraeota bacterium]|nr:hypothetical protein [Candidatus Eremiobacteraeota bacterium]